MKKTFSRDRAASIVLKYLLQLISVALFYGVALYSIKSFWVHYLIKTFSHIYYVSGVFDSQLVTLLIVYSLFCYLANNFLLGLYSKGKGRQLILSMIVDELLLPLGMLIIIVYDDKTSKTNTADTSALYNIYVITALLVVKEIIAARLIGKKTDTDKNVKLKTR
ncbi:MAG TPA: hypothetical protein VHC47_15325 [Mucilaginibacter sp.]|nr:hypothetical protein [Mucilaginibacter sp.]